MTSVSRHHRPATAQCPVSSVASRRRDMISASVDGHRLLLLPRPAARDDRPVFTLLAGHVAVRSGQRRVVSHNPLVCNAYPLHNAHLQVSHPTTAFTASAC